MVTNNLIETSLVSSKHETFVINTQKLLPECNMADTNNQLQLFINISK